MDDKRIIDLFIQRSESAISAVATMYGKYCHAIAYNIIGNAEDTEEVVNDVYNRVWNAIPPKCPTNLRAFIGRITRNQALNRVRNENTAKRGGGQLEIVLSEVEEFFADRRNSYFEERLIESDTIITVINAFLAEQSADNRSIFVHRYWSMASVERIAADLDVSVGKVKSTLFRMRNKLRKHLEREGIDL